MSQLNNVREHPLLAWDPEYLFTWSEWKEAWETTRLLEFRHSLLHFGFQVRYLSPGERIERLLFYLDLADGHQDYDNFRRQGEKAVSGEGLLETSLGKFKYTGMMRGILSEKAFNALCLNFFKPEEGRDWEHDVFIPQVFDRLLWFLRSVDKEGELRNVNVVSNDNLSQIVRSFAFKFCRFIWNPGYSNAWDPAEYRQFLDRIRWYRPEIVRILYGLRKIDVLLDMTTWQMDIPSWFALKDIVMSEEHYFPPSPRDPYENSVRRNPRTLDESIFVDSNAGRVLKLLMIRAKERRRFNKIDAAKRAQREANHQLARATEGG